jgi:hypothetical protein
MIGKGFIYKTFHQAYNLTLEQKHLKFYSNSNMIPLWVKQFKNVNKPLFLLILGFSIKLKIIQRTTILLFHSSMNIEVLTTGATQ